MDTFITVHYSIGNCNALMPYNNTKQTHAYFAWYKKSTQNSLTEKRHGFIQNRLYL